MFSTLLFPLSRRLWGETILSSNSSTKTDSSDPSTSSSEPPSCSSFYAFLPPAENRKSSDEISTFAPPSRKGTEYSEDDFTSVAALHRRDTTQNERLERYCQYVCLSMKQMTEMMELFKEELNKGLESHKRSPNKWVEEESCFKMIDSCINTLPTGNETGVYYALDFGGTNLRAVRAELEGNGKIVVTQRKCSLKYSGISGNSKGLLDSKSTASDLFNHFAKRIKDIMEISGDFNNNDNEKINQQQQLNVGLTFSFPCVQSALDKAILLEWTKGFETGRCTDDPVEGKDVGNLLNEAFMRTNTPAKLNAILNDTVGTLLSCAYQKKENSSECLIGIILGTGSNGCYVQSNADKFNYCGNIINIEFGNFNKNLHLTEVDLEIDWHTSNKGRQLFEKQISGAYLGELVRKIVIRVFHHRTPIKAWMEESLTTEDIATILNDKTPKLVVCKQRIYEVWGEILDENDLKDIQSICIAIFDRSAKLAAIAICAIAYQTGRLHSANGLTCGVDGSLYVKNAWYAHRVRLHMISLLGKELANKITVTCADDGSGKGAAILAAIASSS